MNIKEQLLSELNKEQHEALLYFDGPLRIVAGAGSGKTRVLTRKIAYLVTELGIDENSILALTFTNKAAKEMAARVEYYLEHKYEKVEITTFHSICAKILRKEAIHLNLNPDFQIIDDADKKQILSRIFRANDIDAQEMSFNRVINTISWAKGLQLNSFDLYEKLMEEEPENEAANKKFASIFESYNEQLEADQCLDFDDLIIKTHSLFTRFPEVATLWSRKYSHILIDEFQDTSATQYEIVKALSKSGAQITIVGDPDQTIYGWRGADVNLILNFDKDFTNTKTILLNTNYRSTKTILDAANKLISHNKKRFLKELTTENPQGESIEFNHAFSIESEARWVVQKINELKRNKIQLKNIAIFYRSNYYSRQFEEELTRENINYKVFNGTKFFQRREVKDALAFLRVIYDGSEVSLLRIINVPSRNIGEVNLNKIIEFAREQNKPLFQTLIDSYKELPVKIDVKRKLVDFLNNILRSRKALKNSKVNPIHLVLSDFLTKIGYFEHLKDDVLLKGTGADNVNELIRSIKRWQEMNPEKTLKDYIEYVSLLSAGDDFDNSTNYVTLMTIHGSKGLEFDNIFIVGLSDKIFPHVKSLEKNKPDLAEEERRLAYVAVTRAKHRLFLSDSRGYYVGTNEHKQPSRFIKEMGIDINKFILHQGEVGINFSDMTDEKEIKNLNKNILPGDIISHSFFGEGQVLEVFNDTIVATFPNKGDKIYTLAKNHPSIRLLKTDKES
ncbi:ATP-dependent helicase [Mycoplasmopsis opalescens]|uniref:ATP-dependent helicase n=1 Tax=Mycoplasmopsis opalescens TaxID=114886 RepID=UPI0004A6EC6C|nr:UvrD-helicase domain-containing protein [Mycoplasmopsis opalescens]